VHIRLLEVPKSKHESFRSKVT